MIHIKNFIAILVKNGSFFIFIKKGKFPVFVKMFSEAMSRFDSSYARGRNMAALVLNPSSAPPARL